MHDQPTERQQKIYDFIREYMHREAMPPTNREIGQAVGIRSTGHVDHHLSALEDMGLITRIPGRSRGIRLSDAASPYNLQIVGTIAAGEPLDYYPDTEQETLDLGAHTAGKAYVLLVKGDSMIEDHISSGDYVLIDPNVAVADGDIVVATKVNDTNTGRGAATLKRIYRESGRIRLQPANSAMKPIYVDAKEWDSDWVVQGKVMAIYRQC